MCVREEFLKIIDFKIKIYNNTNNLMLHIDLLMYAHNVIKNICFLNLR